MCVCMRERKYSYNVKWIPEETVTYQCKSQLAQNTGNADSFPLYLVNDLSISCLFPEVCIENSGTGDNEEDQR